MSFMKTNLIAAAAAGVIGLSASAAMAQDQTIVDVAIGTESLSTLVSAVQAADLVETLSGEGPFTVFAPTNDAFAALPDGTLDSLLLPENKDQLAGILTYHVVPSAVMAADVVQLVNDGGGEASVDTVGGGALTISLDGETVVITDAAGNTANVVQADVAASNGVVHVIDGVLMPQ